MRGVAITLACFALIAAMLAWSRWLARRRLASLGHVALAVASLATAAFLWLVTDGLASFKPQQPDLAIARLRFDEAGPDRYRVTLVRMPEGRVQILELPGERWRIEARTLGWLGPAARLGLRPAVRLERFESGPETGITSRAGAGRSYALAEDAGPDVWARARESRFWSRYVEARVAESPWQPMAGGAEFIIFATGGSLMVEPANADGPVLAPQPR